MSGQPERPDAAAEQSVEGAEQAAAAGDAPATDVGVDVAALQAQAEENWDKYLRAMAELENVRKRAARDAENARKFALENFSRELLNVCDSLEMGLAAASDETGPLKDGCEATLKQLTATLRQFGVEVIDPEGQPFDPQQHEAMAMQPSADAEPGTVLTVFQKGYSLNGRLLRPARVVVAQEAPAAAADESAGQGA